MSFSIFLNSFSKRPREKKEKEKIRGRKREKEKKKIVIAKVIFDTDIQPCLWWKSVAKVIGRQTYNYDQDYNGLLLEFLPRIRGDLNLHSDANCY